MSPASAGDLSKIWDSSKDKSKMSSSLFPATPKHLSSRNDISSPPAVQICFLCRQSVARNLPMLSWGFNCLCRTPPSLLLILFNVSFSLRVSIICVELVLPYNIDLKVLPDVYCRRLRAIKGLIASSWDQSCLDLASIFGRKYLSRRFSRKSKKKKKASYRLP